jgi:hypothetical protein
MVASHRSFKCAKAENCWTICACSWICYDSWICSCSWIYSCSCPCSWIWICCDGLRENSRGQCVAPIAPTRDSSVSSVLPPFFWDCYYRKELDSSPQHPRALSAEAMQTSPLTAVKQPVGTEIQLPESRSELRQQRSSASA